MTVYIPALSTNNITTYIKSVISVPPLSREEEIELFKKHRDENSIEAAQKIIMANLKLVVNLAYKFRKFRDSTDLIQEGNLGLLTALKKFEISKGVRFATYAAWWIKAKIQEFIISHMSIVRFGKSRDERKLFFNLVSTVKDIESYDKDKKLSPEEIVSEVAERLSVSVEKVRDTMRIVSSYNDVSINESLDGGDIKRIELKDRSIDYDQEIDENDKREKVQKAGL